MFLVCFSNKLKFQFVHAAMEGLENMAFVANAVSLVTYFFGYMNFSLTKSATTLTNFMGTAFLLALVGGLILCSVCLHGIAGKLNQFLLQVHFAAKDEKRIVFSIMN